MSREDVAAALNGVAVSIAGVAGFDTGADALDDFVPSTEADFLVDAAVRKHFNPMLQKRDEDQDSGVSPRMVQTLIGNDASARV